jgi:hypothetical protein
MHDAMVCRASFSQLQQETAYFDAVVNSTWSTQQ